MNNLTPVQQLILAKFSPDETAKVAPGEYQDEFVVKIQGKITVGKDHSRQTSVPWKKIALYLLDDMTTQQAVSVAKKAINNPEEDKALEAKIKAKLATLLGKTPVKGTVTGATFAKLFGSAD